MAPPEKRARKLFKIERDPEDDELSHSGDYLVSFDACLRLPGAVGSLGTGGTITKSMQNNCVNDYKKFCGDTGCNPLP